MLAAGFVISPEVISALSKRGIEYLEVKADSSLATCLLHPGRQTDGLTELLSKNKELYALHGLKQAIPEEDLEQAVDQITGFFGEIEKGQSIDLNDMRHTVTSLVGQFLERSNLAVKLLDLDHFDRYTYRHSINVGLLFMMVSRDWGTDAELVEMVFGAVLHDLGKARVGSAIINKEGPLTDEEWGIMRQHPGWSADLLREADATPPAISIALWHHEKMDGTGYPDRISGTQLDRYARLAAVCDVYDALTTKRSYKQKMDFARAIDIIIRGCGKHFDPEIAHQFIRRIGRYPVGTFVKLNTAEVAIVLRANEHAINRPVISRVLDATGNELASAEELDLSIDLTRHIVDIIVSPESARD